MKTEQNSRRWQEYGGFLPLELNKGKEYFEQYESMLARFNSVKAGFDYLINVIGRKRIYIPYYYCPSTTEAIRKLGMEVLFYHIDENLMPINLPDEEDSIVLLVDYFGVRADKINKLAERMTSCDVIIDRAHNFFEKPLLSGKIHNVYSAKKFIGVPDGAYVISKQINNFKQGFSYSCGYAQYLFETYELGTNKTYVKKKDADELIASNYAPMSKLAVGLLKNADYYAIEDIRRDNYMYLLNTFECINRIELPSSCIPYMFPLLIGEKGRILKKMLVDNKVFVPTLWAGKDLIENANDFEMDMSENAVFLPVDQRYNIDDMRYIANLTTELIKSI